MSLEDIVDSQGFVQSQHATAQDQRTKQRILDGQICFHESIWGPLRDGAYPRIIYCFHCSTNRIFQINDQSPDYLWICSQDPRLAPSCPGPTGSCNCVHCAQELVDLYGPRRVGSSVSRTDPSTLRVIQFVILCFYSLVVRFSVALDLYSAFKFRGIQLQQFASNSNQN